MSFLRRRLVQDSSGEQSRTPSPVKPDKDRGDGSVTLPIAKLNELNQHLSAIKKHRTSKRRVAYLFGLGCIFGIVIAVYFAGSNDVIDLGYLRSMNLDSLLDVLPAGLVKDAQDLQVSLVLVCLLINARPADMYVL